MKENPLKTLFMLVILAAIYGCASVNPPSSDTPVQVPTGPTLETKRTDTPSFAPLLDTPVKDSNDPTQGTDLYTNTPVISPSADTPVKDSIKPTQEVNFISNSSIEDIDLLNSIKAHNNLVLDIAFPSQGEFFVSSGRDKDIKVWNTNTGEVVHTFPMVSVDMGFLDISKREDLLATGEAIWDLQTLDEIHQLDRGLRYPASVAFSPDGQTLAVGLFDKEIKFIDVHSGESTFTFPDQGENRDKWVTFSPDGRLLASGVADGSIRLWDVDSGEVEKILHYSGETDIHCLDFSPDGRFLASGGRLPTVLLWDVGTGEIVRKFRLRDNTLNLAFSPDGSVLAVSGGYGTDITLWDVTSGDLLRTLPHSDKSMALAFSRDGQYLVVGSHDGLIKIWGIPTQP